MAIKTVVTRGFGNGTFSGTIADVVKRGFAAVSAVTADGAVTLSMSVAGTLHKQHVLTGAVTMTMSVAGSSGIRADGAVTIVMSVAATSSARADVAVTLSMTIASRGIVTIRSNGAVTMALSVSGGGTNPILLLPVPNLPCLSVDGILLSDADLAAALLVPVVQVNGSVVNGTTGTVTVWSINTENFGHTNYNATFDFTHLMTWDALPFGIKSDGIYELVGADDAGANIDSEFRFGMDDGSFAGRSTDFNKRMDVVYLSGRMEGDLIVTVTIDGQALVREYTAARRMVASGVHDSRVKPAKGLKGRYWQLGVKNQNGNDYEIDRMSVVYRKLKRKT